MAKKRVRKCLWWQNTKRNHTRWEINHFVFFLCVDKFLVIINNNCHLPPAVTSGLSAPLCPTSSCLQLSGLSAPPPVSHFVMSSVVRVVCPPMSHFVLSSAVRIICPPLSHFVLSSVVRVVCPPVSHFVLSSVVRVVLHCQKQEAWTVLNTYIKYIPVIQHF